MDTVKTLLKLFNSSIKRVLKLLKLLVTFLFSNTVLLIILLIVIILLGLTTIILGNKITFSANKEELQNNASQLFNGQLDPNAEDYYYQMALALDRDKIAKDYDSSDQMKNYFEPLRIGTNGRSKEFPAKDIDIYITSCEMEARKEINNDSFDSKVMMEFILGNWSCESTRAMGSGKRLIDSELALYVNSSGYADPLGQRPSIFTDYQTLASGNSVGCTYISYDENSNIPDEQRAIYGCKENIKNNEAYFITSENLYRNQDGLIKTNTSDAGASYIMKQTLPSGKSRGSITCWSDAMYTAFYANRVMNEGHDRDTHNTSGSYNMANIKALKEVCANNGFDADETSQLLGMQAAMNRFCKWEALKVIENSYASEDGYSISKNYGVAMYTYMVLIGEGCMDELIGEGKHTLDYGSNTYLTTRLFGNASAGSASCIDSSSMYAKCESLIESGSTKHKYTTNTLAGFKQFRNLWANSEGASPYGQRDDILKYSGISYIMGSVIRSDLETMIEDYYNYQDASGKYIYRLYDVQIDAEQIEFNQYGSGPFGLDYYNSDGSVNRDNLIMASHIFSQVADFSNKSADTITVKGSYSLNIDGKPYSVKLNDGKDTQYPNFWGSKWNNNAATGYWGQCTWWARGRAMLYLYENKGTDESQWHLTYNKCHGDGNGMASNMSMDTKFTFSATTQANSIASCSACHVYYVEAIDKVNNVEYESHGNMSNICYDDIVYYNLPSLGPNKLGSLPRAINKGTGNGYCYIIAGGIGTVDSKWFRSSAYIHLSEGSIS